MPSGRQCVLLPASFLVAAPVVTSLVPNNASSTPFTLSICESVATSLPLILADRIDIPFCSCLPRADGLFFGISGGVTFNGLPCDVQRWEDRVVRSG